MIHVRVICFNLTLTTFARISDRTPVPSSTLPSFTSSKVTPPGSITPFPVLPVKLRAFTWTPLVGRLTVKSDGCCRLQQQVDSQLGALRPGIRCIVGMEDGAQNARPLHGVEGPRRHRHRHAHVGSAITPATNRSSHRLPSLYAQFVAATVQTFPGTA